MNDQSDMLDQNEEDVLSYTVSDEALEAAAGREGGSLFISIFFNENTYNFCCG